ncbi:late embryogenesis abundant protein At1g64065-like [Punica granatum]|uniref:Late embryogenesis abundant protein LEA-2 subgroup domain-containing protein n=2 Tax=Punica granatum TaxID=22663 RepID=A0A218XJW7_PUNGR|nr:late embryogenesis abundant protein At1g64065-like [Punica granatum]OWM85273.1 hypothetical protein CDL15_Pgr028060 [Punica granatum]PKI46275.1 hypothetical protein CRG98_033327 [Punica granatum]
MSDHESLRSHDEKKKRRMKWAAYIAAFAVFQVIVILVFVMVVMKVRTPKFRIGDGVVVQSLTTGDASSSPSFNMSFSAPIRIKNNNFGPYKYDATLVNFTYGGIQVGQATIPKSTANFMGTKKLDVTVSVSSAPLTDTSGLSRELNSGILTLSSQARMNGKSEIMLIFKKKKATNMNCTMEFEVQAKKIKSVECK